MQIVVNFELIDDERAVFRLAHHGGGDHAHVFAVVAVQRRCEFCEDRGELAQAFKADASSGEDLVAEEHRVFERIQHFDLAVL